MVLSLGDFIFLVKDFLGFGSIMILLLMHYTLYEFDLHLLLFVSSALFTPTSANDFIY